jgi:hypothetical protein
MKSYRGIGGMAPRVLILTIWLLYPRERNPAPTEWEAAWALQLIWTRVEKGKIVCPYRDLNSR